MDVPPLGAFGLAELRRTVVIYVTLVASIAAAVARRLVAGAARRPAGALFAAACTGAVDGFIRLGPTFVKLGQVIASSPALFPRPLAEAAGRCLDEVPPFDAATARAVIATDLGRPVEDIFLRFDDRPLSAASIGQVHACQLPDGREAVVKVQRPDIRRRMTTDLRIMHRLARLLDRHVEFARRANTVAVVEELHEVTFGELNPALEAWRQERFRERIGSFGDNRWVTVPEIHWNYCGPHMICMERMYGIPMDDFEGIRARRIDGELVLRRGAKVWLEAVAVHGPFHGDMHAGNLWVLDDGRSTFLDFGIVGELPEPYRRLVRQVFYTFMIDEDFSRIARAYKDVGVITDEMGTDEEVGERLRLVMAPMLRTAGGVSLGDFLIAALEMMKGYGMTGPKELVLVAKQLLYMERYTKALAPQWHIATDLFLIRNIFPEAAAARAAELGFEFPDEARSSLPGPSASGRPSPTPGCAELP